MPRQAEVAVGAHDGVRRHLELVVRDVAHRHRAHLILRHDALRIELERDRRLVVLLGSDREVVHVVAQAGALLEQAAGVLAEDVAVLADRVLVQLDAGLGRAFGRVRLDRVDDDVMDDLRVARLDLHRLDPAILGERHLRELIDPPVRPLVVHHEIVRRRHLQIRLADEPLRLRLEGPRRRHVGRVALRRARVHPADDGGDLVVVQRAVVLVVADADGLVQVPRRHVAVRDALLNRARPRPGLFVGDERHRRRRALVMARLALRLEDRRDIAGERERRRHRGVRTADCGRAAGRVALHGDLHLRVGPAAVIAEVARRLARAVVDHGLQDVLARLGEAGGGRRRAVGELRARGREPDRAGTAILRPHHRHADRFAAAASAGRRRSP